MMPTQFWVSDFTYVSTWQGIVYVAFVIHILPTRSSVGAPPDRSKHSSLFPLGSMLCRKRFMKKGRQMACPPTATGAANTCRSDTHNGWLAQARNPVLGRRSPQTPLNVLSLKSQHDTPPDTLETNLVTWVFLGGKYPSPKDSADGTRNRWEGSADWGVRLLALRHGVRDSQCRG